MRNILTIVVIFIGVLMLVGCTTSDNQTSTTSKEKAVAPANSSEGEQAEEATKQEAKVEVASHNEKKSKYGGASSIVGEVVNNGDADASFVKITATFYNEAGEVVDTGFTYAGDTADIALQPTKKAPFEISRMEDIKFTNYKLDVSWQD